MLQTHYIAEVNLTVSAVGLTDGFALQRDVSQQFWATIVPTLSDIFDRFVSADEVIKIDRLDIQLPPIVLSDWQTEWAPSVCRAVKEALEDLLYAQTPTWATHDNRIERRTMTQNLFEAWLFLLKTGQKPLAAGSETSWEQAALDTIATDARAVEILRGLLRERIEVRERLVYQHDTPYLTQLAEAMSGRKQTDVLALGHIMASVWTHPLFVQKIQNRKGAKSVSFSERDIEVLFWLLVFEELAQGVQTLDLTKLVAQLTQKMAADFVPNDWIQFLANIVVVPKLVSRKEDNLKKTPPAQLPQNRSSIPTASVDTSSDTPVVSSKEEKKELYLETHLLQIEPLFVQFIEKTANNSAIAAVLLAFFKKEIEQNGLRIHTVFDVPKNKTPRSETAQQADKIAQEEVKDGLLNADVPLLIDDLTDHKKQQLSEKNTKNPSDNVAKTDRKHREDDADDEENAPDSNVSEGTQCVATNAGLVLLHPFLKPFFDSIGLLTDGKFTHIKARRRAAALLHYLATGQTDIAEYDMVLPKILVGLPLHKSLDRQFVLTDTERTEVDELLRAVLSHWKALGNTSPDGLREGFLQRNGLLSFHDGIWLLKMEKQTIDILLDRLPWGFSIIRLGWMKGFLHVEWY